MLPLSAPTSAAQAEDIVVIFEFSPAEASYKQGENFTIEVTVYNSLMNISGFPNDIKVTNLSAHFSWMAPNQWFGTDVSGASEWLAPGEFGVYALNMSVPVNTSAHSYSYLLKVIYDKTDAWGTTFGIEWVSQPNSDFSVSETSESDGATVDWPVIVAGLAMVVALGSIGAVFYYKREPKESRPSEGPSRTQVPAQPTSAASMIYPVILAHPGEHFPIEKGFVYLVKEKRPSIAFAMFNEATENGAKGMLVAREHPNRLNQLHKFEAAKILWMTRRVGVDHIDPTELSLLSLGITRFVEGTGKSVVLIEGLEYLITQNDFESVLRFVNHLHDFVLAHDCAIVIVIDPRVLSTRELALLERSARIVEPADRGVIPPERLPQEAET
jgi:hypothetical protein